MAKITLARSDVGKPQLLPISSQLVFAAVMLNRLAKCTKNEGLVFFPPRTPLQHARALKHVADLLKHAGVLEDACVMANAIAFKFPEQPTDPCSTFLFKGEQL